VSNDSDNQDNSPNEVGSPKVSSESTPPKEVRAAIQKLSERKPEKIFEMMAVAGMGMGNPLHQKMEAQHISQVLELTAKHDEREYELHRTKESNSAADRSSSRRYVFAAFVLVVLLITVVLLLFRDTPQVLVPVLSGIGGLVSGFVGGFGLGKQQSK
jgi:hypothetical protein